MKIVIPLLLLAGSLMAYILEKNGDGHWQILKTTNEPAGRSECGLAAVNGKIYLVGGDGPAEPVEMLNPETNTWIQKAMAPVVMHHFQAVPYKNKVYILDAFSEGGFPNQIPMANVYMYDTEKDQWQKGCEIPVNRRRAGAGAAEYNGKIYLVAGIKFGHSSGTNNMFDVYDPETNTWDSLADAPHIRDHCFAAVVKDKLYIVGGRNTSYRDPENKITFFSQTVLDVDCYDFKTRQWTTLNAKLPLGSGGGAVVNLNDKLYYMGGERATATTPNGPKKNTYYLDPASQDQWTETDSLHNARNGLAAVVLNNKIYAAGGAGGGPGGPPPNGPMPGNPNGLIQRDTLNRPQPGRGPGGGSISVEVFSLN
jgi:N-acetylneuraminic acid mutarotase